MRRILFFLFAAVWCFEGLAFQRIIHAQGLSIGGREYFNHVGIAGGIAAEQCISVICFVIAALAAASAFKNIAVGNVVRWLSFSAALAVAIVYVNFLGTIPVISIVIHNVFPLFDFPAGFGWAPVSTFFLAIFTGAFAPSFFSVAAKPNEKLSGGLTRPRQ